MEYPKENQKFLDKKKTPSCDIDEKHGIISKRSTAKGTKKKVLCVFMTEYTLYTNER
ncbi:MAG TPA: hypothetical protein H9733_10555 [Candidatus Anaerotignum merdipullorum]|nr:hypothetical protein [Candidatus Anaerotignum merdipullorum]